MNQGHMHRALMLVMLCASGMLGNACVAPSSISKVQPFAGIHPPAKYRQLILPNGLEVLLVSKPGSDRAAASLSVSIGAADDPPGREGMAHFLEHMLFLGTDKYPEAGEYQRFLNAHGGTFNAYTALEETNYFLSVRSESLEPALARFSRFFIAPLIDADYTQREREAVDAEYHAGKTQDNRRLFEVLKTHMNPEHPYAQFHVGNLETLQGEELHREVRDFYAQHYGARSMKLSIIGGHSLETLYVFAQRYFSEIVDSGGPREDIEVSLFSAEQLGTEIRFKPKRDERSMLAVFPVANPSEHYRSKPLQYIAHLLGHEGKNSLYSLLKQRGWASRLSAGHGLDYRGGSSFDVNISLTEEGIRHQDEVTRLLFETIHLIRTQGIEAWRFKELSQIADLDFRYRELGEFLSYAVSLTSRMHKYPIIDILHGPYLFSEFNPTLIKTYLDDLRPDNMVLLIRDPELESNQRSHWYDVPYTSKAIDASKLADWSESEPHSALGLAETNPFIAQSTQIYPRAHRYSKQQAPTPVAEQPRLRAWYYQDERFKLPRADVIVRMDFAGYRDTLKDKATAQLWVAVLRDTLNEYLYPAYLAGIDVTIHALFLGMELRITGYNDKQEQVLAHIVERIQHFEPDRNHVQKIRAELVRDLRNTENNAPYQVLNARFTQLLIGDGDTEYSLATAIEAIDERDLHAYTRTLSEKLHIQSIMHGNILPETAHLLIAQLQLLVESSPAEALKRLAVLLPEGVSNIWHEPLHHSDASLILALQAEDDTPRTHVMVSLSQKIMRADFFRQLRTEQQLGYVVYMSAFDLMDLPGLSWTVQSPNGSATSLEQAIRAFIAWSVDYAQRTPTAVFNRHRENFIELLKEEPKTLVAATEVWWEDIIHARYRFDRRDELISAARTITREQWLDFYRHWMQSDKARELILYSAGLDNLLLDTSKDGERRHHDKVAGFRAHAGTDSLERAVW